MQNHLRHWIALVEAATPYGGAYWFYPPTGRRSSAYVSSSTGPAVWAAVKHLIDSTGIDKVEIEIARPNQQIYTSIGGDDLTRFLRAGPKKADAFLLKYTRNAVTESVEYSNYGYWVKPNGEALIVPNSSHYKVLLRHYQGNARYSIDRYEEVIKEGWCWVCIAGQFFCFVDPEALTGPAVMTLQRIINEYPEHDFFRIVVGYGDGGGVSHEFDTPMAAKGFLRGLR